MISNCLALAPIMEAAIQEVQKKRRELSCDFNVFNLFNPGETMHSKILAHLLDPRESHGQGNCFLYSFLKMIEIESPELGIWHISCEAERIDVCLERNDPLSIIIIENKSNWAGDQGNQLYRYWFKKMYPHHKDNNDLKHFYKSNEKYHKILYLTPDASKQPSPNTLNRPDGLDDNRAPGELPIIPEPLLFRDLVGRWLYPLLKQNQIRPENHRMCEYIKQYIEFWM